MASSVLGEHNAPQEFALREGFVERSKKFLRGRSSKGGNETREGLIRARVALGQDQLTRCAKGRAKVIDLGGDQGTRHDAPGHEGRQGHTNGRAKAKAAASYLWVVTKSDPAGRHRGRC